MTESRDPNPLPELTPADAEALDALVDAGFDAAQVDPRMRDRANAIARLLAPIEATGDSVSRDERIARTIAAMHHHQGEDAGTEPRLTPAAEDALDAFVMARGDIRAIPAKHRPIATSLGGWRSAITRLDAQGESHLAETRSARIDTAMAAIFRAGELEAMPIRGRGPVGGFRMRDLISVAAMLLLASAVLMPVVGGVRAQARQTACLSNLDASAQGIGLYANDYQDQMPMATAGFGGSWMRVGSDPSQSNSANLYTLARTRHATLEELSCPGNRSAPTAIINPEARDWENLQQISFSYQILPGSSRPRAMLPSGSVVMTDRSPVILRAARGEPIVPEANSPNHGGEGQHVMHLDGSVRWHGNPVLSGGDNLWLPRAIELRIHGVRTTVGIVSGHEMPDSPEDAFVGP